MAHRLSLAFVAACFSLPAVACSTNSEGTGEPTQDAEPEAKDDSALPDATSSDVAPPTDSGAESASDSGEIDSVTPTDGPPAAGDTADTSDVPDAADATDADTAPKPCVSGSIEEEACGKCGKHARICDAKVWLPWGICTAETGECVPKEERTVDCGRCGTRKQSCDSTCTWISESCVGQKGCFPGTLETSYGTCLDSTKVKTRTCSDKCEWGSWSECT